MATSVTTDEIYERYLRKAITEINRLSQEIAQAADGAATALPTGLVKLCSSPQAQELQEGVAFHGGGAALMSLRASTSTWRSTARNQVRGCDLGVAASGPRRRAADRRTRSCSS